MKTKITNMEHERLDNDCGGRNKRARTNPLEGANSISKLARVYDKRIQETRSAKGLAPTTTGEDDCEITPIGSTSHAPAHPVKVKTQYKEVPALTLEQLLPAGFKPEAGRNEPAASKLQLLQGGQGRVRVHKTGCYRKG